MAPFTLTRVAQATTGAAGTAVSTGLILPANDLSGYVMGMVVGDDNAGSVNGNVVIVSMGTGGAPAREIARYARQDKATQPVPFDFRGGEDKGGLRLSGAGESVVWVTSQLLNTVTITVTLTIWPAS